MRQKNKKLNDMEAALFPEIEDVAKNFEEIAEVEENEASEPEIEGGEAFQAKEFSDLKDRLEDLGFYPFKANKQMCAIYLDYRKLKRIVLALEATSTKKIKKSSAS